MGGSDSNLKLYVEEILLSKEEKNILKIHTLLTFPHGLDGLKLWEAGIILARYVILHSKEFEQKRVLELGSGVGIGGIAVAKYTQCTSIEMTDYNTKVLENINKNCKLNRVNNKIAHVSLLDWRDEEKNGNYDIIIGSDIIYFGCPVKELYEMLLRNVRSNGKVLIIVPVRKNYAELFLQYVEKKDFLIEKESLNDSIYKESPFKNEEEGHHSYPLIKNLEFDAYILVKK